MKRPSPRDLILRPVGDAIKSLRSRGGERTGASPTFSSRVSWLVSLPLNSLPPSSRSSPPFPSLLLAMASVSPLPPPTDSPSTSTLPAAEPEVAPADGSAPVEGSAPAADEDAPMEDAAMDEEILKQAEADRIAKEAKDEADRIAQEAKDAAERALMSETLYVQVSSTSPRLGVSSRRSAV